MLLTKRRNSFEANLQSLKAPHPPHESILCPRFLPERNNERSIYIPFSRQQAVRLCLPRAACIALHGSLPHFGQVSALTPPPQRGLPSPPYVKEWPFPSTPPPLCSLTLFNFLYSVHHGLTLHIWVFTVCHPTRRKVHVGTFVVSTEYSRCQEQVLANRCSRNICRINE